MALLFLFIFSGAKFSQSSDSTRIIEKDGRATTLDPPVEFNQLTSDLQHLWKYVQKVLHYLWLKH